MLWTIWTNERDFRRWWVINKSRVPASLAIIIIKRPFCEDRCSFRALYERWYRKSKCYSSGLNLICSRGRLWRKNSFQFIYGAVNYEFFQLNSLIRKNQLVFIDKCTQIGEWEGDNSAFCGERKNCLQFSSCLPFNSSDTTQQSHIKWLKNLK